MQWYKTFVDNLMKEGFKELNYAKCVFVNRHKEETIFILLYVDDIIITSRSKELVESTVNTLSEYYSIRDLGPVSWILNLSLEWKVDDNGCRSILISQYHAIEQFLED